ncbi:MAG: AMP-binding protein [Betaproteobacteria bacterium]
MTQANKLILDYVYAHEKAHANQVFLTQPLGGGRVADYTWTQTLDQARRMATHLKALGYEPGARIGILSKNCAHFFMAELAIWMAGYTTVAIFPTESAQTIQYVLEHSGASLLFIGKLDTWPDQEPGVPAQMPRIAFPLAPATSYDTWDAITARNAPMDGQPARPGTDLAMLIYTSGSTGQPKGVMHSFERITAATELAVAQSMSQNVGPNEVHRVLSYLPLAHVFERSVVECASFVSGQLHVYFAESLETFAADLQRARPTIFVSVPRLWLKFQQAVFAKMPQKKLSLLLSIPIVKGIVAKKILTGLGLDQTILAFSGSAPLPADLIRWYRSLGLQLLEGLGMTEDFAYSHTATPQFSEPGYVGVANPGVQARISPEGEILIKSPGQLVGYYKRPDLDAEAFTADGFFHTGDLGMVAPDGQLKITGRMKELFKTSKGKYVAPAPIENLINVHPMVEISLVGGLGYEAAFAIVVLAEDLRPRQNDPALRAEVTQALQSLLAQVNAQVADYEHLKFIVVAAHPWQIENGMLTPTMKIKRSNIETSIAARLDGWYASGEKVLWA